MDDLRGDLGDEPLDDLESELRATARAHLARLLPKVLEDGQVDEAEKQLLLAVFRRAVLTKADVRQVFGQFLKGLADGVLADGIVTPEEQEQCRVAVRELRIPRSFLTPDLIAIVDGTPPPSK
jgi:hypothetical protein